MGFASLLAAVLLCGSPVTEPPGSGPTVDIKLTQKYLVAVCVDGAPVKAGERRIRVSPGEHTLAFTMRNAPRSVASGTGVGPGIAVVRVSVETGRRYEAEIRGPVESYSTRVWTRGEWKPAIRDRTLEQIVSGDPVWLEAGCEASAATTRPPN